MCVCVRQRGRECARTHAPSVYKLKEQKQHKVLTGNKDGADKGREMRRREQRELITTAKKKLDLGQKKKSVIIITGVCLL